MASSENVLGGLDGAIAFSSENLGARLVRDGGLTHASLVMTDGSVPSEHLELAASLEGFGMQTT